MTDTLPLLLPTVPGKAHARLVLDWRHTRKAQP